MPKTTCTCNDDSTKEYVNEAPTFQTHYHFDNTFVPTFQNPSRILKDLVKNGGPVSLVDRANCNSCDDSVSTQEKLKVRKKDRPTPYRVPYNHFRKVTSCITGCDTNVKIIKDLSCNDTDCVPVNYSISRLVDKNGIRNLNNGGNYKNYLQLTGKTYYQNTAGILPENAVSGKINTYKIGSVEKTVNNYNSGTSVDDCQLGYGVTTSLFDKSFTILSFNTTTKKYSNPSHKTSGSVSSKQYLHKKKFRNILAGQGVGKKDGYNNCRNGEFCTLYMKPGPNTKLFMGKTPIQRCIPPRIRGMKQTCVSSPLKCGDTLYTNPRFQREENTSTLDGGTLTITIDHCPLFEGDEISISFLGYSTTVESIFEPTTNTDATDAITSAQTTTSGGEIITLTITQLTVNTNIITWVMPVNVGKGTTQIVLSNGDAGTFINETNGPPGVIYANVTIPRHFAVYSRPAWSIIPIDPCYYRQLNGTGAITAYIPINTTSYLYPNGSFVSASVPNGTTHNPEDILMRFTLSIENFVQGDVLSIDFYTSSSFGTGFFNTTNYPTGISNWNLANAFDSYSTIPTILLANFNSVSEIETPMANAFSSALWSGTTQVNLSGSIYYKQRLSITIGSGAPSTSSTNESYYLYLFRGRETVEGETTYTKLFSDHPASAGEVKFSISCTCFTGTGITDGYNFGGPCSGVASNAAFTINTATEGMSLADYDDITNLITPITTYTGDMDPDIVKFTFSLSYTGNQGLTKGDVIVFRITTDYGDQYSGFFTSSDTDLNDLFDWQLNKRPQAGDDSFISIWLEQNGTVLDGNGYGIESINFANFTSNTNTNVYSHFLYVTIGKNITNISNAQGSLTLGIYANNDIITSFPDGAYNISYEIDSYCWTSTGNQSDISFDPCSGRSGSLTNSSLTVTGYDSTTPGTITGGDYIELAEVAFTASGAGLLGGDVLLLKLIVDYQLNASQGFWTEDILSGGGVNFNSISSTPPSCWFTQGTNTTPVSGMIQSITLTSTTSGNPTKWIQVMSITLAGTSTTTYGSAGTNWKFNMQGKDNDGTMNITQTSYSTAGSIDYELDLNCFTGTGEQEGVDWSGNPCYGRGGDLDFPNNNTASHYPNSLDGGVDLDYLNLPFTITPDQEDISLTSTIKTGDVIVLKIYTTPSTFSFFDSSYSGSSSIALNTGGYPGLTLQTIDTTANPATYTTVSAIESFTITDSGPNNLVGGKRENILQITLKSSNPSGDPYWFNGSDNINININNAGINDLPSWINQFPNANGTFEYNVDVNCMGDTGTGNGFTFSQVFTLSNLSLLPANFAGENRGALLNSLPALPETTPIKTISQPWKHTVGLFGITTSGTDYNVVLKFTISDSLSSGDTIKLTMKRAYDSTLFFSDIFTTDPWPVNSPGQYNDSYIELLSGSTAKNLTSVSLGNYNQSTGSQEITLTVGDTIPASNITINFYNDGFNNWQSNVRDGTPLTFDLEVTGHQTSTSNLGWYVQDLGVSSSFTLNSTSLFNGGPENSTRFIYRHYSAIPQNSKIRLIFAAEHVISNNITYTMFDTNTDSNGNPSFSNAQSYLVNTSTPTTNQVGVTVTSKDLNNTSTSNNISIGSFTLGGLASANYVAADDDGSWPNTNHGSIEYLEFTVTQSGGIPGDTPTATTAGTEDGGKYIEIDIDMRNPITQSDLTQNIAGNVEYSIQVFDPNNVLIGGAYAYTGLSYGTATSLSLLPNNFEGFQRSTNGLGLNLDTQDRQKPFYDLKNTQGRNGQTGSSSTENLQFYTNSEIAADLNLRNITSRFTIDKGLPSGSEIKLTFWKQNDNTLSEGDRPFFSSGAVGSNTTADEPFTLTGGYSNSENLYIEGKYKIWSGETVFTFSSYTISSYDASSNEQSITLTTAANIPANANIKIIFHDHFGDALCSNPREGRGIYYDLEITPASSSGTILVYTKQEDNLGWYSQDISANLDTSAPGWYPPSSLGVYIFSNDLSQPSILTYRHHNAIPSGSKIRLTWSAEEDPFSPNGSYNFFKSPLGTTSINNTSSPSTGNVGIVVVSHTTLNSTSGTDISISDFTLGTLVATYNENEQNNSSDNHGSLEYIEFEIDNNIAGAPVSKTTNAATRFIEIKVYGGHNLQPPGGLSGPSWYAKGDHHVSIEVRNSDDILIGAIYNVFYYQKP